MVTTIRVSVASGLREVHWNAPSLVEHARNHQREHLVLTPNTVKPAIHTRFITQTGAKTVKSRDTREIHTPSAIAGAY